MAKYGTGKLYGTGKKHPATAFKTAKALLSSLSSTCIREWSIHFFHPGVAMNSKLNRAAITFFLGHSHTLWWVPTGNHSKVASNAHRSREPQIRASPDMMFVILILWRLDFVWSGKIRHHNQSILCWEEKWGQYEFPARSDCWCSVRVFRLKFKISSEPIPWSRSFSWGAGWGTSRNTKILFIKEDTLLNTLDPVHPSFYFWSPVRRAMTNDQRPHTSHWESNMGKDMGRISQMYCAQNSGPWSRLWTNERKQIRFSQWIWKAISKFWILMIFSTVFQLYWAPIHLDYNGLLEWVLSPLLKNGRSNSQDGKFPVRQWKPSHLELVEVVHHMILWDGSKASWSSHAFPKTLLEIILFKLVIFMDPGKHMFSSRTREGLPIFLLHQLEIIFPLLLGRLAHCSLWNPAQLLIQDLAGGHVLALKLCEQVARVWPSVFQTCGFDIQSVTTCTALGNTKLSCGNKCMDWYKPPLP